MTDLNGLDQMNAETDLIIDTVAPVLLEHNFVAIALACLTMAVTAAQMVGMDRTLFNSTLDKMWDAPIDKKTGVIN